MISSLTMELVGDIDFNILKELNLPFLIIHSHLSKIKLTEYHMKLLISHHCMELLENLNEDHLSLLEGNKDLSSVFRAKILDLNWSTNSENITKGYIKLLKRIGLGSGSSKGSGSHHVSLLTSKVVGNCEDADCRVVFLLNVCYFFGSVGEGIETSVLRELRVGVCEAVEGVRGEGVRVVRFLERLVFGFKSKPVSNQQQH